MIDIKKANIEFDKYISNYNPENPRIALKVGHIKRVAKVCKLLAENLNFSEEEVKLAELIGLFHDIGRFEQVRIADTFSDRDSGINHGEMSIQVLFENNLIRNFIEETQYDDIIKKSVLNHNKALIESGLTEKELIFSKLIRDADKLDILYTIAFDDFYSIFWYDKFDCEKISDIIMEQYKQGNFVKYSDIHNNADMLVAFYGYIYDLNFDFSLKYLAEKKFLDTFKIKLLENFTNQTVKDQIEEIHGIYQNYIQEKIS